MNRKLIQAILAFLTLITIGVSAHGNELINEYATADVTTPDSDTAFRRSARANGIPTRLVKDFSVTKNGYYIIAGVYGDRTNADKFVKKLKLKQLNPQIITHPVSKLNYVSLAQFENWKQAINSCSTAMNGKYNSEVWIMNVQGSSATINTRKAAPENKNLIVSSRYTSKEFMKAAKENKIAARIVPRFKGLKNGYYIVAGVFGDLQNVKSFQKKLSKKGS